MTFEDDIKECSRAVNKKLVLNRIEKTKPIREDYYDYIAKAVKTHKKYNIPKADENILKNMPLNDWQKEKLMQSWFKYYY